MSTPRIAASRVLTLAATALLAGGGWAQTSYPPADSQSYANQGYPPQTYLPEGYPNQQAYQAPPPPQQPPPPGPATNAQGGEENADDPSRGVARIAILQGEANVKRGDSGELVAGAINAPLMTQDHLITAPGSRAEIQFDAANVARLAPSTEVILGDVEYHKFQIQLVQGTLMYAVVRDLKSQAEIDTPSIAIHPRRAGEYRVTILPDGTTEVTVRSGSVEIFSPSGSETIEAGHTILVRGQAQSPELLNVNPIAIDDFDRWSAGRDQQMQHSVSSRYMAADINGADDLDQYGRWVPSQYGQAWVPNSQGPDFAPYSNGQWVWEDYYGWTWVDAAPWGWAPYHYGRWFQNGGYGWAWYPGPILSSYFWRPALVGFFGFGGFSIGFGFGSIGWCPLAPFELFHPWYGRGFYGGRGNSFAIIHNTNIAGVYRNARYMNGVTGVSANNFGNGRQAFSRPSGSQLAQAGLMRGGLPVAPTQRSLQFSQRGPAANAGGFSRGNQQFYSRFQASNTPRVPFSTQARQMQQFSRNSFNGSSAQGGFRPAPQSSASSGWHSFGQSYPAPGQSGVTRAGGSAAESSSGWHAFGSPHQPAMGSQPNGFRGTGGGPTGGNMNSGYTSPQSTYRGGSSYGGSQPRGNSSYPAPSYNSPARGGYSAPPSHYSGGSAGYTQRAPSSSAPHAAPSGGSHSSGGGSKGGGGGHAAGGGGGHGGGGHHR